MSLNVGVDFKQRWAAAPETVRQIFLEDLNRICELLEPSSDIELWQKQDHNAEQMAKVRIQKAYAQLKAELIEQARIQKQKALEAALAQKRAEQAAFAAALQADEQQQFQAQTAVLQALASDLNAEVGVQMQRYNASSLHTAAQQFNYQQALNPLPKHQLQQQLQLQADQLIEQAVTVFRAKLHHTAQREIERLLLESEQQQKL